MKFTNAYGGAILVINLQFYGERIEIFLIRHIRHLGQCIICYYSRELRWLYIYNRYRERGESVRYLDI